MDVSQTGNKGRCLRSKKKHFNSSQLVDGPFGAMAELSFNVDHGYLEGLVRGMKAGILTRTDYHNLAQCETLEGMNVTALMYLVVYITLE